jgi:6-pyruvoyltetrahydropterin/6-carboxytetrahydropterin synthase
MPFSSSKVRGRMMMYAVSVEREFIAQHFLFGGDWGRENKLHAHHYSIEAQFKGKALDGHGYLLDITVIEVFLDEMVNRYRDSTLNSLPEFSGLNPSIEHFARIICDELTARIAGMPLDSIKVKVRENNIAWASYMREF